MTTKKATKAAKKDTKGVDDRAKAQAHPRVKSGARTPRPLAEAETPAAKAGLSMSARRSRTRAEVVSEKKKEQERIRAQGDKLIKVRATQVGQSYDQARRRVGDVFLTPASHFSYKWMELADKREPVHTTGSQAALNKRNKEIKAQDHLDGRQAVEEVEEERETERKVAGDTDVLGD
jgi:hypothetical protein